MKILVFKIIIVIYDFFNLVFIEIHDAGDFVFMQVFTNKRKDNNKFENMNFSDHFVEIQFQDELNCSDKLLDSLWIYVGRVFENVSDNEVFLDGNQIIDENQFV
jgi:hypothetical protein